MCSLTLGLLKVALLDTLGNGAVDVRVEGSVRNAANLVVGLDILLDGLTAADTSVSTVKPRLKAPCLNRQTWTGKRGKPTCYRSVP